MLFRSEPQVHDDELVVLLYELYHDLARYLQGRKGTKVSSLEEVIEFNQKFAEMELQKFGQELFEKAMEIGRDAASYKEARNRNVKWAQETLAKGLNEVDVLIGCTYGPAWKSNFESGDAIGAASWITTAPAIAGTPIGSIPMRLVDGLPVGMGFVSARNQEAKLITAMAQAERALELGILKPTFSKKS